MHDSLNHGWRCIYSAGLLVHDEYESEWHVALGLFYVLGRLLDETPTTLDDASDIAARTLVAHDVYLDVLEAYEAHERQVRELDREKRRAKGEVSDADRAARYVARMDASVAGAAGTGALFRAAVVVVRGFALEDVDALAILRDFNARAVPPWPERELVRAMRSARRSGRMEFGALLGARRAA